MKAVQKFRALIDQKRPGALSTALGKGVRSLHSSENSGSQSRPTLQKSRSVDIDDRRPIEAALAAEGIHHDLESPARNLLRGSGSRMDSSVTMIDMPAEADEHRAGHNISSDELLEHPEVHRQESGEKGHAHDPLDEEPLFLGIGTGGSDSLDTPPEEIVAESPAAAEFSIYDTAYQQEVDRIRAAQGTTATVYLTRRVDSKKEYQEDENMVDAPNAAEVKHSLPHQGFKGLLDKAREKGAEPEVDAKERLSTTSNRFSTIAAKAMENTRALGKEVSDRSGDVLGSMWQKATEKKKE
jgi:calcium/calmodulin-dependent protein kinase kinase 2